MNSWISALILTDALEKVGVFRAAGAALLVAGAGWLSYRLVGANVSPEVGRIAGWGVPAAMLAWALWRPARTTMSANIVYGVLFCLRLLMFVAFYQAVRDVFHARFHVPTLLRYWQDLGFAAALWGGQRLLAVWAVRSERVESARLRVAADARRAAA